MKLWNRIAGATLSTILLAACAGPAFAQAKQTTPPKTPSKGTAPAKSTTAPSFDKSLLNPAALTAKAPDEFEVKFSTTKGDFTIKVTRAWSPNGADRFYNLVKHHFYDDAPFYRAVAGFMVQFGISAYPEVTKAWANATIKDDKVAESNKLGYITYAMTGQRLLGFSRICPVWAGHIGDGCRPTALHRLRRHAGDARQRPRSQSARKSGEGLHREEFSVDR
jgi:hypothetical protein